ncbi:uncharacterized protein BDV14DRAFT_174609, partial [Aspergillus stella-maris]|uniref:uncharacterized protein n=1 Tax=Aspergillus stella-maris TaxID=1810926 RepID=UPI003CCCA99F
MFQYIMRPHKAFVTLTRFQGGPNQSFAHHGLKICSSFEPDKELLILRYAIVDASSLSGIQPRAGPYDLAEKMWSCELRHSQGALLDHNITCKPRARNGLSSVLVGYVLPLIGGSAIRAGTYGELRGGSITII